MRITEHWLQFINPAKIGHGAYGKQGGSSQAMLEVYEHQNTTKAPGEMMWDHGIL